MKKTSTSFIVTMPPPTPNGGLHVGHMTGPFLSADAFAKAVRMKGQECFTTCYSDVNQSYVRVTAQRQNRDPLELSDYWTEDMKKVLKEYRVEVSDYFPVEESREFVRAMFHDLYARGVLVKKRFPFFACRSTGELLDEAGVSGYCPRCLAACKCGICEACSGMTNPLTLLHPTMTLGGGTDLDVVWLDVMVLELERFRDQLRKIYDGNDRYRPRVLWVVEDALSSALPDFPVTVPGSWGIAIEHPDFPGQVVNAWPEIMSQQVYSYKRAQSLSPELGDNPAVVNFFGFDNAYFIAVMHAVLLSNVEDGKWVSHAAVTNEFYNLDHSKFSTSNNHVVWAGDLARRFSVDEVRFYAAFNTPGFEKANFNENDMALVVEKRLHSVWNAVARAFNQRADSANGQALTESAEARTVGDASLRRIFESFSLKRFHLRQAAEDLLHLLELISAQLGSDTNRVDIADVAYQLKCFALAAHPLMPIGAAELYTRLTGRAISRLDADDRLKLARLPERIFGASALPEETRPPEEAGAKVLASA